MRRLTTFRWVLVGMAGLTGLTTLVVTQTGAASATTPAHMRLVPAASRSPQVTHATITTGSVWTNYDNGVFTGFTDVCEVITFHSGHKFTDDAGDAGTWSKNVTLKYTTDGAYAGGTVYAGKYNRDLPTGGPGYTGAILFDGLTYGASWLLPGNDPLHADDC